MLQTPISGIDLRLACVAPIADKQPAPAWEGLYVED
jgi:hypothetical protein